VDEGGGFAACAGGSATAGHSCVIGPPGYALEVDPLAVDSRRFEELLRRARVALGRDDPERAAGDLQTALALWRGEALPTIASMSSPSARSRAWRTCV
jgi:Bacterial transcriptional activator domain